MKLLAIDTATEACSAALYIDGEIVFEYQLAPREHTKLILGMVEALLAKTDLTIANLDAVSFGRGPGSFSGVRIATGVAQGLAFAADLPVVPVSTLASIAQFTYNQHGVKQVAAAIDARMGGVYWGCYQLGDNGLMQLMGDEQVAEPTMLQLPNGQSDTRWVGAGSAWKSYMEELKQQFGDSIAECYEDYFPHSASIVQLAVHDFKQGKAVEASQAQPVYLRNDVAKKSAQQGKLS